LNQNEKLGYVCIGIETEVLELRCVENEMLKMTFIVFDSTTSLCTLAKIHGQKVFAPRKASK
jgi:hypothetical protein